MEESSVNQQLREAATKEVINEQAIRRRKLSPMDFIKDVAKRFIEKQIDYFPTLCEITRYQNKIKQDELRQVGIKGKYTDSYGWSESMNFKHEFEIPSELYLFMVNLVYRDFWSDENRKVWVPFMRKILKGEDAMQTLMWVKTIYGSNSQKETVTTS